MYSLAAIASQNAEENDFNGTRTKIDETFTMLYPVNGVIIIQLEIIHTDLYV